MIARIILIACYAGSAVATLQGLQLSNKADTGWKPLPSLCGSTSTAATTVAPPMDTNLTAAETIVLNLVNSFRANYESTPEVSYNQTLGMLATECANSLAEQSPGNPQERSCIILGSPTLGQTVNVQPNDVVTMGLRGAIADPSNETDPYGWFGGFGRFPVDDFVKRDYNVTTDRVASGFLQMIWSETTEVGCGYSASRFNYTPTEPAGDPREVHAVVCLWSPGAALSDPAAQRLNIHRQL